jgi:hypothetical protein
LSEKGNALRVVNGTRSFEVSKEVVTSDAELASRLAQGDEETQQLITDQISTQVAAHQQQVIAAANAWNEQEKLRLAERSSAENQLRQNQLAEDEKYRADLVAKARQLQILQRIDPDKPALYPPPARQAELLREIRGRPAVEDVGAQRLDEEAERQRDQLEFEQRERKKREQEQLTIDARRKADRERCVFPSTSIVGRY